MLAVLSLLVVMALGFVVTRVATVALTLTGLSQESARFQARSAFTGCGFTTAEAEAVVGHPVRRKIVLVLMQLGSYGFVGAAATLFLSFVNVPDQRALLLRSGVLFGGCLLLVLVARSAWIERRLARLIGAVLRRVTDLDVRDYHSLLRLSEGFAISELSVEPEDWLAHRSLAELNLLGEGITVLSIRRADGDHVAVPHGATVVVPGDLLLLYGHADAIARLDERKAGRAGEVEHARAVASEEERLRAQDERDAAHGHVRADAEDAPLPPPSAGQGEQG